MAGRPRRRSEPTGVSDGPVLYFITHPDVVIDPAVPITEWPLSPRGRTRMAALASAPWIWRLTALYCSTERKARDGAALADVIASSTIRGTQRGRMLQKVERADEMAEEIAELRRSAVAHHAELAELRRSAVAHHAELKHEREKREAERAEHKVELAGAVAKSEQLKVELSSVVRKLETKNEKLDAKNE